MVFYISKATKQALRLEVLFMSVTLSMSYSNSARTRALKMNCDSSHSLKYHLSALRATGEEECTSKEENKEKHV